MKINEGFEDTVLNPYNI